MGEKSSDRNLCCCFLSQCTLLHVGLMQGKMLFVGQVRLAPPLVPAPAALPGALESSWVAVAAIRACGAWLAPGAWLWLSRLQFWVAHVVAMCPTSLFSDAVFWFCFLGVFLTPGNPVVKKTKQTSPHLATNLQHGERVHVGRVQFVAPRMGLQHYKPHMHTQRFQMNPVPKTF